MLDIHEAAELHSTVVKFVGCPFTLQEMLMVDYSKFVARRDTAISKMTATIKDMEERLGSIVDQVARNQFERTIKAAKARLASLESERKGFLALVEEFKRLDEARAPKLPLGIEGPARGRKGPT